MVTIRMPGCGRRGVDTSEPPSLRDIFSADRAIAATLRLIGGSIIPLLSIVDLAQDFHGAGLELSR